MRKIKYLARQGETKYINENDKAPIALANPDRLGIYKFMNTQP
jgi:hypothetical protein